MCKTELALLSRLIFVDYALMATEQIWFYPLMGRLCFIACAWAPEE